MLPFKRNKFNNFLCVSQRSKWVKPDMTKMTSFYFRIRIPILVMAYLHTHGGGNRATVSIWDWYPGPFVCNVMPKLTNGIPLSWTSANSQYWTNFMIHYYCSIRIRIPTANRMGSALQCKNLFTADSDPDSNPQWLLYPFYVPIKHF